MKTLFFSSHGTVELRDGNKRVWSSDADDDFQEETDAADFLDPNDEDEIQLICDYLIDEGLLDEDEEIDIEEEDLEDFDDDGEDDDGEDDDEPPSGGNIIEGQFKRVR